MINDIYICRTHIFKVVLSLALLNYLTLLKSTKKKKIYISKKIFFQKYILIFTPKFGSLSLLGGPRRWPKWPRPKAVLFCLTHLGWNSAVNSFSLVGIYKDWPTNLNISVLLRAGIA